MQAIKQGFIVAVAGYFFPIRIIKLWNASIGCYGGNERNIGQLYGLKKSFTLLPQSHAVARHA